MQVNKIWTSGTQWVSLVLITRWSDTRRPLQPIDHNPSKAYFTNWFQRIQFQKTGLYLMQAHRSLINWNRWNSEHGGIETLFLDIQRQHAEEICLWTYKM